MYFNIGSESKHGGYRIGRGMFAVADRDKLQVFTPESTKAITDSKVKDIINNLANYFIDGFCYRNAKAIVERLKENGIKAVFYAGWLFVNNFKLYPVHHAWVVIDGNVIDVNIRPSTIELTKKIDTTDKDWRKKHAKDFIEDDKRSRLNLADNCTMGKVMEDMIYAGSPDTEENAIKLFLDLKGMYPQHPSKCFHNDKYGMTELQREIFKRR